MRRWSRYLTGVVAVTGLFWGLNGPVAAESFPLTAKQIDLSSREKIGEIPISYLLRYRRPQVFVSQVGDAPVRMVMPLPNQGKVPEFTAVVKKQPAKYVSKHPFRGVARVGTGFYGFVFDEVVPETPAEPAAAADKETPVVPAAKVELADYQRLYFDTNGNGDLTDDQVLEASQVRAPRTPRSYRYATFAPVTVTGDTAGNEFRYEFAMTVTVRPVRSYSYAQATLTTNTYLDGEITVGGKQRRVLLIDMNSNGRFDDPTTVDSRYLQGSTAIRLLMGDVMWVLDPETSPVTITTSDPTRCEEMYFVGDTVHFGGQLYDMQLAAGGDLLTLSPTKRPVGFVSNANQGYRALVYGDQGVMRITPDESGKAALPTGSWKLAWYTIDRTEPVPAKAPESSKPDKTVENAAAATVQRLLSGGLTAGIARPKYTMVSARANAAATAVQVAEGQTVALPFGAPYRPVVTVSKPNSAGIASLRLALIGAGGESCSSLVVNGQRPGAPEFKVLTEDGQEVTHGVFKYG